jgi:uncharacterized membrane protein YkvA (DUF1232 family)
MVGVETVLRVVVALVAMWALLLALLWWRRPEEMTAREALRVLPDLLGLVRRLATDRDVPPWARWTLWALLGYLALPIDLVPDVLPVIGYADDVIVVAVVLRLVVRACGETALDRHWRGGPAGLAAVRRLAGL